MTICWMKEGRNERQEPLQGGKAKKRQKTQNECDVRPYPLQLRLPRANAPSALRQEMIPWEGPEPCPENPHGFATYES